MIPIIKIFGIGGSGSNTVSRISKLGIDGVELIAANTDAQALNSCRVSKKILIGKNITKGLGAGMDVSVGKKAAQENKKELEELLRGADMVFITCGLGGGTGSGASPVIAEISKNMGILTIAAITMPFSFEGEQRRQIAKKAADNLRDGVDSLLMISNDNLLKIINEKTTVSGAFELCDDVLRQAIKSITDLIFAQGIINIDFPSIVSIMKNSGNILFGTGRARGENRAVEAAKKAITSPLLNFSLNGSSGVIFNVSGNDVSLNEIKTAAKIITENVDSGARIVFGATKDDSLKKGEIKITVIAAKL